MNFIAYENFINNKLFPDYGIMPWHNGTMATQIQYVTVFWKTDHIVTLGLFHFIGPTNGYTRTLHIHSAIIRLG